jgi:voltage-dependent potassium channel beta subunit
MEYRRLGNTGLQISALSLGSWLTFGKQISDETADELMSVAYDAGINFFDNAEIYARGQSEIVMGKILSRKKWERSSYLVSSKVFFGTEGKDAKPNQRGLSRKHIIEGCHEALKRLQVDYLDLYFCHRADKQTPIEETVWSMHQLILQGKILYWGTSEWDASEIMEAIAVAKANRLIGPVVEQPQYNMMTRGKVEREYAHLFRYHGLGTTIWSPLASGVLTGKYNDAHPGDTRLNMEGLEWLHDRVMQERTLEKVKRLKDIANELGISMARMALAWCLKNPNVSTVLLGASKAAQLKENIGCLSALPLITEEVMQRIEQVLDNKPSGDSF